MEPVMLVAVICLFVTATGMLLNYSVKDFTKRCRAAKPLPQIDRLEALVEEYVRENYEPRDNQFFSLNNWQDEFDNLVAEIEWKNQESFKEYTFFNSGTLDRESALLEIIKINEHRYGVDHWKTQRAVQMHQEMMNRWDRRLPKNGS